MTTKIPSVGRIVHYVSYGTPGGEYTSQCRAAVITEVLPGEDPDSAHGRQVGLAVLNPSGMFFNTARYDEPGNSRAHAGGTWHWPEQT